MKKNNNYPEMGLKALQRAAGKVAEHARKNNYKIPVWTNGHIEYVIPDAIADSGVVDRKGKSGPGEY